jgi:hypothetical protein
MTIMTTAMIAIAALTGTSFSPALKRTPAADERKQSSEKKPAKGGFHTDNRLQLTVCSLRP